MTIIELFTMLSLLIEMSWKAICTNHTSSKRTMLYIKLHNNKTYRVTHKEQMMSTMAWMIVAFVNLIFAIFGSANYGTMYGLATFNKYLFQGNEAHDLLTGIFYDLSTGLKEVIINETWIGGLLDTLANYNGIQLIIILMCSAYFSASFAFMAWTVKQYKLHRRRKRYH